MPDVYDRATRSRVMRSVRGANTQPELELRRELWRRGIRGYRIHRRDVPGCPDIAWLGLRVAVFLDGSWWHGHPSKWWVGRSGEYWDAKIQRNIDRDAAVNRTLEDHGWLVVRVWDFELRQDIESVVNRIGEAVESRRRGKHP